jgi:hypothetical protein
MMYFRKIALAATLAGGMALPALAQQAPAPDTQPATATPMPDTGVKKVVPSPAKHTHHTTHKPKHQAVAK